MFDMQISGSGPGCKAVLFCEPSRCNWAVLSTAVRLSPCETYLDVLQVYANWTS